MALERRERAVEAFELQDLLDHVGGHHLRIGDEHFEHRAKLSRAALGDEAVDEFLRDLLAEAGRERRASARSRVRARSGDVDGDGTAKRMADEMRRLDAFASM